MQNGYVTKDENLRWIGQFFSAIRWKFRQSILGYGVRTVEDRMSFPQKGKTEWRWNLNSLERIRPMR